MGAVAVVGGGIAGLTAAYRLKQRGTRVVVYEAGDRVGGSIRTERRDGYIAELGPNALASPSPALRTLIAELGLEPSLLPASPAAKNRYVIRKGKLLPLPLSPQALLTTRLLSNGAKLAVFGEPLVEAGESPVEESVATFVRRRFNQEVLDYVANPFVGGIYAGDPEQLSVRLALPKLYALERTHGSVIKAFGSMMRARKRDAEAGAAAVAGGLMSFRSGLSELPEALGRALHSEIRLRAPVTQLRAGPKGWTVGAAFQQSELYDGVVWAAPAHRVDELDLDFPGAAHTTPSYSSDCWNAAPTVQPLGPARSCVTGARSRISEWSARPSASGSSDSPLRNDIRPPATAAAPAAASLLRARIMLPNALMTDPWVRSSAYNFGSARRTESCSGSPA
jgi:protoporphyrinogen/coproporphyrinogen III oxidase